MTRTKWIGLFLGIAGFLLPLLLSFPGLTTAGHIAMGIFLLAAVFWMFEVIPIYSTSLLVIFLQVTLLSREGFLSHGSDYSPAPYTDFISTLADPIIILFLGGFVLADAAVKYNFDKNMTRILLRPFGSDPKYIILGLMSVTAILSAFMSNTATTAMMITVLIPILARTDINDPARIGMALSIPFAANIGGVATPIGTPPNAVVIAALNQQGLNVEFGSWMVYAAPLAIIMLLFAWYLLLKLHPPAASKIELDMKGSWMKSKKAITLYVVFAVTVLLWITETLHGIRSAIVALLPVVVLTLTSTFEKEDIRKLPWEVLWLIAGGISLGLSMQQTGLADWVVDGISWEAMPYLVLISVFALVALVLSNFLSNTVTASLMIPLGISLATSGVVGGPASVMMIGLVIALSTSFAMVLPISTPPNAIAVSTGVVKTKDMIVSGSIIGITAIILVIIMTAFYWPFLL
ncbi:MAG: DASS family sodium-coupled anion symporter [Balneolaceae bacterium]|nr:DASS family sodium-coupled anion symporter [Balneolaceae bacterium]MCH8550153.1 DASS family sodium-coupled anion symporter [Balneolaceae bacterium]